MSASSGGPSRRPRPGNEYRARPRLFRRGGDGIDGLRATLPQAAEPAGRAATGAYPSGSYPPGSYPPDSHPPDSYPPDSYPPGSYPPGSYPPGGYAPGGYPPGGPGGGATRAFPAGSEGGFRGGPGRPGGTLTATPPGGTRRRRRRLSWKLVLALLLVLVLGYPLLLAGVALNSLTKVAALPDERPADTSGHTYLVVGSDSRAGLSAAQRKKLATGKAAGSRTDTIMLLHVPDGDGPTVLVSIPRDSYVSIPGRKKNKINAAFAFGGPQLLVRTVEQATGLTIDDYIETGLGGYADLVDAIGGVNVCSPRAIKDKKAGLDIPKGCQDMDGATALGYARARYSDPRGDLGRVERQRQVLAAIAGKTLSPGVVLAPWNAVPAAGAGGSALVVDEGTSPFAIGEFVLAMRAVSGGNGLSLTVPIGNPNLRTSAGSAVGWDTAKAKRLFAALAADDTAAVGPLAAEQKVKQK